MSGNGDYISREAFIKWVEETYCKPCEAAGRDYNHCRCGACQYDDMMRDADSFPAADAIEELSKPKWIPVTERLPEEYKDVLCYYEYFRYGDYNCMFRTIDRGYYGNGIWGGEAGQGHKNKVLAWMLLPEPPKEEAT